MSIIDIKPSYQKGLLEPMEVILSQLSLYIDFYPYDYMFGMTQFIQEKT